ncbi:PHP domain-containing protein [Ferrimonas gelatinilytica]|uniref:PHP domain-containing protein n=1 Tax=Ferrimonas gelatinilytica TaxID=1255257 RepID=A0ABP9RZN0_9GAMM
MKIDLHCHSRASDGTLTPTELVIRALNQQIDLLALTDHDSVEGLAEARAAAEGSPLRVISGVEVSTRWHSFDIHVVGLDFDSEDPELRALLHRQADQRRRRAETIAEKLTKRQITGTLEDALGYADGGSVGRSHFARVLVDRGIVAAKQAAFDKYLGRGQSAYVPNQWCTIAEAVTRIQGAGGLAVLAHPSKYQLSNKWLRKLLVEFKAAGGDAMEAIHCQQNLQQRQFLQALALEYDLLISAGSDFHFPSRWVELGRGLTRPEQPGVWHQRGWV